jgi:hypothetical protein
MTLTEKKSNRRNRTLAITKQIHVKEHGANQLSLEKEDGRLTSRRVAAVLLLPQSFNCCHH